MEYKERTDIRSEVSWPLICFGDGYMGRVISQTYGKDSEGKDVTVLKIIPTDELIKKYNISVEELDSNKSIKRSYPSSMIQVLSHDPGWPVIFCYLNLDAQECEATQTFLGKMMSDKLDSLRQIISMLKAENAYLQENLEKALTNVNRYIKENIVAPANDMSVQVYAGGMPGMIPQQQNKPLGY